MRTKIIDKEREGNAGNNKEYQIQMISLYAVLHYSGSGTVAEVYEKPKSRKYRRSG